MIAIYSGDTEIAGTGKDVWNFSSKTCKTLLVVNWKFRTGLWSIKHGNCITRKWLVILIMCSFECIIYSAGRAYGTDQWVCYVISNLLYHIWHRCICIQTWCSSWGCDKFKPGCCVCHYLSGDNLYSTSVKLFNFRTCTMWPGTIFFKSCYFYQNEAVRMCQSSREIV